MKKIYSIGIIALAVIFLMMGLVGETNSPIAEVSNLAMNNSTNESESTSNLSQQSTSLEQTLVISPTLEPAELWNYDYTMSCEFFRPRDPSKYVMPNNKIVQYYADQVYVDGDGTIRYYEDNKLFLPDVVKDTGYPHGDYWYNPDYYLTHRNRGDCEDYALTVASILLAKGVPAVVVVGYIQWSGPLVTKSNEPRGHVSVEYVYNHDVRYVDIYGYYLKQAIGTDFEPVVMFNNQITWQDYEEDWYKYYGIKT